MPIKIPKGFQRRRSSGNALEELPNPPEPSFRVFERPEASKSFDGGNNLKRSSYGRPLSAGQSGQDQLFVDGRPNLNPNNRYFTRCRLKKAANRPPVEAEAQIILHPVGATATILRCPLVIVPHPLSPRPQICHWMRIPIPLPKTPMMYPHLQFPNRIKS